MTATPDTNAPACAALIKERHIPESPAGSISSTFAADGMVFHWTAYLVVLASAMTLMGLRCMLSDEAPQRNVEGNTAPGFKKVAEAFRILLLSGEEKGGAFSASYNGQLVVDLWGGYSDFDAWRPWRKDTLSQPFSAVHGLSVASVLLLADRGLIDLNNPVAHYWPEFGEGGKQNVSVVMLLNREVAIAPLDAPIRLSQLDNVVNLSSLLGSRQLLNVSSAEAYKMWRNQPELLELYFDLLIRRVDSKNRSLAAFMEEEIAWPFGVDFHVGLTPELSLRVARLTRRRPLDALVNMVFAPRELASRVLSDTRPAIRELANPSRLNDPEVRLRRQPHVSSFATARSLVALYGLLTDAEKRLLSTAASRSLIVALAPADERENKQVQDDLVAQLQAWFWPDATMTPSDAGLHQRNAVTGRMAFGSMGQGGQYVFADTENNLVMAYLTNYHGVFISELDPRVALLQKAVYECVQSLKKRKT